MNQMTVKEWYTSEEIAKICNVSTKTIERKRIALLKVNPELKWFKTSSKPYKYHHKMIGEFLSEEMVDFLENFEEIEKSMKNIINQFHKGVYINQKNEIPKILENFEE